MIVDSSALVAIVFGEPDADRYAGALYDAGRPKMSAATWFESTTVVDSRGGPKASGIFDQLVARAEILIVDVTVEHARIARLAYRDYGKGSGHPAQLNFGDCFSYALAAQQREPLLFKGDDFGHTDLTAAELPAS